MTDKEFTAKVLDQVQRLGTFERFQYLPKPAVQEHIRFFQARTRDLAKVEGTITEALTLETLPTLSDLNRIWTRLYVEAKDPELSDEERQRRAEYLRDWYGREAEEAKVRRAEYQARSIAGSPAKVTEADIEALKSAQERNLRNRG